MSKRTVSHLLLFLRIVRYSAQGNDSCCARLGAAIVVFGLESFLGKEKVLGRGGHCSLRSTFEGLESLRLAIEARVGTPKYRTTCRVAEQSRATR